MKTKPDPDGFTYNQLEQICKHYIRTNKALMKQLAEKDKIIEGMKQMLKRGE